ncbi:hypothetical protein ACHHYP_03056 [Achlya hypogyna]|uniref:LRRK2 ARM repeat domain-containing protein n=1 Tax=Achlya hypogyna TaxID=1202772 RepID=A0A1V9Z4R9_ACHHY|nr:hypothetical protein ACHHYP_03056 [Achlya hypogyna]
MAAVSNPLLPLQLALADLLERPIHAALDDALRQPSNEQHLHHCVRSLPPSATVDALDASLAFVVHARALLTICSDYLDQHIAPQHALKKITDLLSVSREIANDAEVNATADDADVDEAATDDSDQFASPKGEPPVGPWSGSETPAAPTSRQSWWAQIWGGDEDNDSAGDDVSAPPEEETLPSLPVEVANTIASLAAFPTNLKLQLHGLEALVDDTGCESVGPLYAAPDMLPAVLHAISSLAQSKRAQIAGLSLLANPNMPMLPANLPTQQVRRLILRAMQRFKAHAQIQGLGCLALSNLCRDSSGVLDIVAKGGVDAAITAMRAYPDDATVQSAGSWLLALICASSEDMQYAVLDAGSVAVVEAASRRFQDDDRVRKHADMALREMLQKHASRRAPQCAFQ